jgi:hypothetical protein
MENHSIIVSWPGGRRNTGTLLGFSVPHRQKLGLRILGIVFIAPIPHFLRIILSQMEHCSHIIPAGRRNMVPLCFHPEKL